MTDLWAQWWVWLGAALVLAILETLAPGYIFLGIALGAAITAGVVALPFNIGLPALMAVFAVLSLISWFALRRAFKPADDQTRIVHEDINK
ncbi:NfeD family protein [Roseovarius sp. EL26]|uniref:NfeD family protein n=1 Tax=Roseovarius sp. EL26 TaxID=2126672 RepID=UPI000EA2CA3B|nr:hypothetical protein [Roseovarius sp. EL26]